MLARQISNRMQRAKANKQHVFLSVFLFILYFGRLLGGKWHSGSGETDKTLSVERISSDKLVHVSCNWTRSVWAGGISSLTLESVDVSKSAVGKKFSS